MFYVFLFISISASGADPDCEDETGKKLKPMMELAMKAAEEPSCPNAKKVRNICMLIDTRSEDKDQSKYKFRYQRQIYEAACVSDKDSKEERSSKIQKMWSKFENDLNCNSTQFDVMNGNILKFAATTLFDDFILDAIEWKVNLNKIDEFDGRTILDYLQHHMNMKKGSHTEKYYKNYYKILREAGAKHKSEL